MQFFKNYTLSEKSKLYLVVVIFSVVALCVFTAVTFLWILATKLDVIMTQKAGITYTYFLLIMDRILALWFILIFIPFFVYQLCSKGKNKSDKFISFSSVLVFFIFVIILFSGYYHYFKSYKNNELSNSDLFCKQRVEYVIFDKIIKFSGNRPVKMCQP